MLFLEVCYVLWILIMQNLSLGLIISTHEILLWGTFNTIYWVSNCVSQSLLKPFLGKCQVQQKQVFLNMNYDTSRSFPPGFYWETSYTAKHLCKCKTPICNQKSNTIWTGNMIYLWHVQMDKYICCLTSAKQASSGVQPPCFRFKVWLISWPLNHFKTFHPAVYLWLSWVNKALMFLKPLLRKQWFLSISTAYWLFLTVNVSKDLSTAHQSTSLWLLSSRTRFDDLLIKLILGYFENWTVAYYWVFLEFFDGGAVASAFVQMLFIFVSLLTCLMGWWICWQVQTQWWYPVFQF